MIKSEVVLPPTPQPKPRYPRLMRNLHTFAIAIALDPYTGFIRDNQGTGLKSLNVHTEVDTYFDDTDKWEALPIGTTLTFTQE